ncbi:hypothetical protein [Mucilaginibacter pedocola]|uniref:Uncharacterized protein n=1 Tax=Mucilaginibacter pedocola TaxID=1792845 RepID=A0A1S9P847_9SPHI|nr:hypothetical protein [Mucilaginibacter pedocola]OOQ57140.1 hypothetical protein BC343_16605 [Mucilaginibacter pedocola]
MYNPSLQTTTNKPIGLAGKPVDARSYFYDDVNFVYRPYLNTAEVLNYLSTPGSRTGQFSIIINSGGSLENGVITGGTNAEWWFKDSVADTGLLPKGSSSGGGGIGAWGYIVGDITDQDDLMNALNNKVDKVTGYGLSENNYTNDEKALVATIAGKVDEVAGYGLSANDYTNADKELVGTIAGKQENLGFTPENIANKNVADGYAGLDNSGKVPSSLLPSYVDDVIEVDNYSSLPVDGETGKIYVTRDTNYEYRWGGSGYVRLVASPGSTDAVPEGSLNLYFNLARVLGTLLSGLSLGSVSAIAATDNILQAFGKLQAQISFLLSDSVSKSSTGAQTITGGNLGILGGFVSNYGGRIATWAGSVWNVSGGGYIDLSNGGLGGIRLLSGAKSIFFESNVGTGTPGETKTIEQKGNDLIRVDKGKKALWEGDIPRNKLIVNFYQSAI